MMRGMQRLINLVISASGVSSMLLMVAAAHQFGHLGVVWVWSGSGLGVVWDVVWRWSRCISHQSESEILDLVIAASSLSLH